MSHTLEDGLTAEDHAYRHAARTYFEGKSEVARANFEPELLAVFESFEQHWSDFFAPSREQSLREYLNTPFEVRQAQFERFHRECRAWEVSFRLCVRAPSSSARGVSSDGDWSDLKQRLDAQRSRAEEVREFYGNLDSMLDAERRRVIHPIELLPHLRALGVTSDATLVDIKKQYKKLARMHHPDRQGDAITMSRLNDAYRAIVAHHAKAALTNT